MAGAAMLDFLFIGVQVPCALTNRAMAMLALLHGPFVFIPKRILPSQAVSLVSAVANIATMPWPASPTSAGNRRGGNGRNRVTLA